MKKLFFSFVGLLLVGRLWAVSPVPLTEAVNFSCRVSGNGGGTMIVYDESAVAPYVSQGVVNQTLESDVKTAYLRPGKIYTVHFESSGSYEYWLNFTAPAGYSVYIENSPVDLFYQNTGPADFQRNFSLELHPLSSIPSMRAGAFSGIDVGKSISWEVGLAGLRSGRSAGRLLFKEKDLTNAPASRDRLYFSAPGDVGQVQVVKDGASNQTVRQIGTPQFYVDLVDVSGGYEMRYYSAKTAWNGPILGYDFTGLTPWRVIKVESPVANQLKITETEGTISRVSLLSLTSGTVALGAYVFTLQEGDGTTWPRTTVFTSTLPASPALSPRDLDVTVKDAAATVATKTKYHFVTKPWGQEEITDVYANPGANQLTTSYVYYETAPTSGSDAQRGNYSKIKSVTSPTGAWTSYAYYDDWNRRGQLQVETRPFVNLPGTVQPAASTIGNSVIHDYSVDFSGRYRIETSTENRITDIRTGLSQSTTAINYTRNNMYFTGLAINTSSGASSTLSSETETIDARGENSNADYHGLPLYYKRPDGTIDSYGYYNGSYSAGVFTYSTNPASPCFRTIVWHGTSNPSGAEGYSFFEDFWIRPLYLVPYASTKDVTIRNSAGDVIRTEMHVYTGGGNFTLVTHDDYNYDIAGRFTQHFETSGALTENFYTNGRLTSTVDVAGTETTYTYDALGRVATTTKKGVTASGSYPVQGDIVTTNTYDAANHVLQAQTVGGTLTLTANSTYDLAGRQTSSTAPGSFVTGYAYSLDGKTVTTTLPGGAIKVTETYLDGQLKNVSGTGAIAESHTYSIENSTTGRKFRQSVYGGNSAAWTNTYWDWVGHQVEEWKPGWNGSAVAKLWYYETTGQLVKFSQTGFADMRYTYDTLGQLASEGRHIDGTAGALDANSTDRIKFYQWMIHTWDNGATWWYGRNEGVYTTANNGTTHYTRQTNQQLSGFTAGRISQSTDNDTFGNTSYVTVDVDRTGKKLTTTTYPSDSSIHGVQVSYNGLTMESTDTVGVKLTYAYDALGRQTGVTDPRTGTSTTAYKTGSSLVDWVKDAANVTQASYTYDTAGRVATMTDALSKVARYSYTTLNQKYREWGNTTYPVEYAYDTQGRQTQIKTYALSAATFTGTTWPASPGTPQVTTFTYHAPTGFLSSKTDDAGKAVTFTYTQAGQIATRTLARGVVTTYTYSPTTGEVTNVAYTNDPTNTPQVTYTYDRVGNVSTVTDYAGTRTFTYNLAGTLELQREDLPAFLDSRRLTYTYDTVNVGTKGRPTTFGLGSAASNYGDQYQDYAYQADGRLTYSGVYSGGNGGIARGFNYGYQPNSHLINNVSQTSSGYTDNRIYDATHDWVDNRATKIGALNKATFAYTQDTLGRITVLQKTGEVFNRYNNGTAGIHNVYTYNDRSELASDTSKVGTTATIMTGRTDAFTYDLLGNRKTAVHNGDTATYTTNTLNEYSQRTVPGIFDVAGAAATAATVTVNGSNTGVYRSGQYFFKGQALANSPNPVNTTLAVSDGTTTTNLPAFLAGTPEAFTYDFDGNLFSDGRWTYSYDGENRLVSMTTASAAVTAGYPKLLFQFFYDYLGRRIWRIKYTWNAGTSNWDAQHHEKFFYRGWNLIAETNGATGAITRNYYWGLDLTGTSEGAGGVGGLLVTQENNISYLPAYDAMGNVHGMINATDGSLVAAYEYDSSGNTIRESGTYAASNSFRYSTKYTDIETGLIYYGHRYYNPSMGHFINRDPIEESGGLNLYGFCGNNGVNRWDYLGNVTKAWHTGLGSGDDEPYYRDGFNPADVVNMAGEATTEFFNFQGLSLGRGAYAGMLANIQAVKNDTAKLADAQKGINDGRTVKVMDANGTSVTLGAGVSATFGYEGTSIVVQAPGSSATAQFANYIYKGGLTTYGLGDERLVSATAGYLSEKLGNPGQFDAAQAALHEFVDALDHPLSPFNFMGGVPSPVGDFAEQLDAYKTFNTDIQFGSSNPSIPDAANNVFAQAKVALNNVGPWMGVATIQTQTYTQTRMLFGLLPGPNKWIDNTPMVIPVTNSGLPGGYYASPAAATSAAASQLKTQLIQLGYLRGSSYPF